MTEILWCYTHHEVPDISLVTGECRIRSVLLIPKDAPSITIDDAHPMGRLATLEQVANAAAGRYVLVGELGARAPYIKYRRTPDGRLASAIPYPDDAPAGVYVYIGEGEK